MARTKQIFPRRPAPAPDEEEKERDEEELDDEEEEELDDASGSQQGEAAGPLSMVTDASPAVSLAFASAARESTKEYMRGDYARASVDMMAAALGRKRKQVCEENGLPFDLDKDQERAEERRQTVVSAVRTSQEHFRAEYDELMALPYRRDPMTSQNQGDFFPAVSKYANYEPKEAKALREQREAARQSVSESDREKFDNETAEMIQEVKDRFWVFVGELEEDEGVAEERAIARPPLPEATRRMPGAFVSSKKRLLVHRHSGKGPRSFAEEAGDLDVETDEEAEESDKREQVERFRTESATMEDRMRALLRLEKMKPRSERGGRKALALEEEGEELALEEGEETPKAVLGTQILPSPEVWTPSWQFPFPPGLSLLECNVLGEILFEEMDNQELYDALCEDDSLAVPIGRWHSWRRHWRDAIMKLQRQGHLASGWKLKRYQGGDVVEPFVVLDQADGEPDDAARWFMRVPVESGQPLDIYARYDDAGYDVGAKPFWPQQLSIGHEEYASKFDKEELEVRQYKELAEYHIYEELEMSPENVLTPQEIVALRVFPRGWFYYQLTDAELDQFWAEDLRDEDLENEAMNYSATDRTVAELNMYKFVSEGPQLREVTKFQESYMVEVDDGGLFSDKNASRLLQELLQEREREHADAMICLRTQRRARAVMLNQEQARATKSMLLVQTVLASNIDLSRHVIAMQAQLKECETQAARPSMDGDAAGAPQAAAITADRDENGWSTRPAKSNTASVRDLQLDEDQRRWLVRNTQDLFADIKFDRPKKALYRKAYERNQSMIRFWKKMMRVNESQWPHLKNGSYYWNFLEAESATVPVLYALYEVLVLNINPAADGVYNDQLPEMWHKDMLRLASPQISPFPLTPYLSTLSEEVQKLTRGFSPPPSQGCEGETPPTVPMTDVLGPLHSSPMPAAEAGGSDGPAAAPAAAAPATAAPPRSGNTLSAARMFFGKK